MIRSVLPWSVAALFLVLACDRGKQPAKGKDEATKKTAEVGKTADASKTAEAETPAEAKAPDKHFDVSKDQSGILARTAAVLETDEAIDSEALQELSHHAEKITSVEEVCRHVATILGRGDEIKGCVKDNEHHVVRLGPELYSQAVQCLMEAKTAAEVGACEAAEKEAEELLHEQPHGEGLDEPTCDGFFTHFENLAMEDAGDQAELVKEILEEVRADVVASCVDQGTKAEIDCAMGSKSMAEIKECASKLL